MKKLTLITFGLFVALTGFGQSGSIFTDSIPGLRAHAKQGKHEALIGAYLQFTVDEDGPYFTANYSRIGRKWGFHVGITKRAQIAFFSSGYYGPYPGLNIGGQFYLNRLHSTFVPFFHGQGLLEYVDERDIGPRARVRLGYGNMIHLGKYFYLDWRAGVGVSFGAPRADIVGSLFFAVGFGYNFVNYGKDMRR